MHRSFSLLAQRKQLVRPWRKAKERALFQRHFRLFLQKKTNTALKILNSLQGFENSPNGSLFTMLLKKRLLQALLSIIHVILIIVHVHS